MAGWPGRAPSSRDDPRRGAWKHIVVIGFVVVRAVGLVIVERIVRSLETVPARKRGKPCLHEGCEERKYERGAHGHAHEGKEHESVSGEASPVRCVYLVYVAQLRVALIDQEG